MVEEKIEEIKKDNRQDKIINRQKILILLCWLCYTIAYLGRYGFSANINLIIDDYGVSRSQVGLVTSFFFFAYGIGQIVHGIFCKKYNKRFVITFSLIVSVLLNLTIFCGINFAFIKYLWLVNGFVQAILWPTLIEILSNNLDKKMLKSAILVMSTTTPLGTLLVYGLSAGFVSLNAYKFIFLVAIISMATVSALWFFLYRKFSCTDNIIVKNEVNKDETNVKKTIFFGIIVLIVVLSIFAVVNNLIKDGLTTWVPTILKDTYKLPDYLSILLTIILPILGTFGSLLAIFANKFIKNYISLITIFFVFATLFIGLSLLSINNNYYWFVLIILFGLTVLIMHSINNVITSMVPLYMRDKINSGLVCGLLNGFCYVGSTISSYGIGKIADSTNGWNTVFLVLTISSLICVAIGIIYTICRIIRNRRI